MSVVHLAVLIGQSTLDPVHITMTAVQIMRPPVQKGEPFVQLACAAGQTIVARVPVTLSPVHFNGQQFSEECHQFISLCPLFSEQCRQVTSQSHPFS